MQCYHNIICTCHDSHIDTCNAGARRSTTDDGGDGLPAGMKKRAAVTTSLGVGVIDLRAQSRRQHRRGKNGDTILLVSCYSHLHTMQWIYEYV